MLARWADTAMLTFSNINDDDVKASSRLPAPCSRMCPVLCTQRAHSMYLYIHVRPCLQALASRTPAHCALAWHFIDEPYHRTSFTFAGWQSPQARRRAIQLRATGRCPAAALDLTA